MNNLDNILTAYVYPDVEISATDAIANLDALAMADPTLLLDPLHLFDRIVLMDEKTKEDIIAQIAVDAQTAQAQKEALELSRRADIRAYSVGL